MDRPPPLSTTTVKALNTSLLAHLKRESKSQEGYFSAQSVLGRQNRDPRNALPPSYSEVFETTMRKYETGFEITPGVHLRLQSNDVPYTTFDGQRKGINYKWSWVVTEGAKRSSLLIGSVIMLDNVIALDAVGFFVLLGQQLSITKDILVVYENPTSPTEDNEIDGEWVQF